MKIFTILLLCFASITNVFAQNSALLANKKAPLTATPAVQTNYKFIQNRNQWDSQVLFRATIPNGALFVKHNAVLYSFLDPAATAHQHDHVHNAGEQAHQENIDNQTNHNNQTNSQNQTNHKNQTKPQNQTNHKNQTKPQNQTNHKNQTKPQNQTNHKNQTNHSKGHGVEVEFLGANPQSFISPIGESTENYNYFIGNDQSKWTSNLKAYNQLEFQKLYEGIMMRYVATETRLKYEFIVAPQANPKQIQLKYKGATQLNLDKEGNLQIGTSVLDFMEQKPYCYQLIEGEKVEIPSKFVLKDSVVTFELGEYDVAKELVIDPELIFASYSGSNVNNYGMTATFDNDGNLYAGGIAFGQDVPPTTGAFDMTFGGVQDILVLKFNPDGTNLLYATFLGGATFDSPNSLIVNSQGNLVVMSTTMSDDYPTTLGAYDRTHNGDFDIAIAILNPTGSQLISATFVGGNGSDGTVWNLRPIYGDALRGEVDLDSNDNIYVASVSNSDNFPTVNGGIGSSALGSEDGVVFRLSANLSALQWSTYIGGSNDDGAYSVAITTAGDIIVAGTTQSDNFNATPTAAMPLYRENTDGFIRKYSANGVLLSSTFLGSLSGDIDHLYMMDIDTDDNVYVFGNSVGNHPISPNTYNNGTNSGHFLYKFNSSLTTVLWSTKLGSPTSNISVLAPTAFMVSNCGTIFLSGWGEVNSFMTTPDALYPTAQPSTFYLAMYGKNCSRLEYATFFGGLTGYNHVDGGTSRFSKDGIVYQSMCIGDNSLPTTPNAWRNTNGLVWNNAAFKMNINPLEAKFTPIDIATGLPIQKAVICFPITVKLRNESRGATSYHWNLGVFGTSNAFEPIFTITQAGNYPVSLSATNASCTVNTSRVISLTTNNLISDGKTICIGESTQLNAYGGTSYTWTPTIGLNNPTIANPIANPTTTTTYHVRIDYDNKCTKDTMVTITVKPLPFTDFNFSYSCIENGNRLNVNFNSPLIGGATYLWNFGNGQTSSLQNPPPITYKVGNYRASLTITSPNTCTKTISKLIIILPVAEASVNNSNICVGSSTQLNARGGTSYAWTPTTGLDNATIANPIASPTQTTTYTVKIINAISGCVKDTAITVTVRTLVAPAFSTNIQPTCIINTQVILTNNSINQVGTTYLWDFGNGQTSNLQNPPTINYQPGNYTIRLTTNPSTSCIATYFQNITINNNTIQTTISSDDTICIGNYSQLEATGGTSYTWTPTTGLSNPNIANPIANPTTTTTYSVVISNGTCQKTETVTVEVNERPTAIFAHAITEPCATMPLVTITNNSVAGVGATYLWDFGNGQTSADQNPAPFRYAATGTYPITLTVRNANGCERTITNSVTVTAGSPIVSTISPLQRICETTSTPLLATGGTSYTWTPATGLSNPNIANPIANPSVTTTYSVVISNGTCQKTETVTVEVNERPTAIFAHAITEPCATMPLVTITNNSVAGVGATYLWDFGNGQTSTDQNPAPFRYAAAGNYVVTLTVRNANGCERIITNNVTVTAGNPIVSTISPLQRICETTSTPLLATGGTSYTWTPTTGLSNPNIANPVANPTTTTTYSVVISNGTCQKTETVTVEVNERPTAIFAHAITEPCAIMPLVTITNNSVAGVGATYLWDFGNGQTSTDQNPTPFRYATAGTYPVTLTVRNANGCERTITNNVTVTAGNPIVSTISPLQRICETTSTPLLATGGTSYTWTPATGLSNPNIANPVANPSVTTTYSVVISNGTCQKTETVTVEVNERPTAIFAHAITEPCATMPLVTITNNSVAGVGATYLWDFGNGQTSTDQNPTPFRYATAGTYPVTLTVRNADGCERSSQRTIVIDPNPSLDARASGDMLLCVGTSISLSASGGTSYAWTPTTGLSNPNIANPIANPSVTTTYTVRVSNAGGCFKDIPVTLTVFTKPTANFTARTVDSCSVFPSVILQNQSANALGYLWDFGNGQTSSLPNPTVNYTQEGRYVIRLTAYNGQVCRDFTDRVIDIRRNQQILPTIQPYRAICAGDTVQLQVSGGTRYVWTPATGLSNATIANPKASPSQTTTYQVQIFNALNCRKDTTLTVQVFPKITTNFEVKLSENCTQFPLVTLNNLSSPLENVSYVWDFGNGQTSNLRNPAPFRYAAAGTYTITLNVRNAACVVVKTYQLNYKENANYNFANFLQVSPAQQLCLGDSVQLAVQGGNNLTYLWTPATGLSNPNIANPKAAPTQSTLYNVLITNQLGCRKDTSVWVNVLPPVQAEFDVTLVESCDQVLPLVQITPRLRHGLVYVWDFGNGSTYTGETPPAFRYATAGKYTIKLKGTNQACSTTTEKRLTIEENEVDFYKKITLQPAKPTICAGEGIKLTATGGVKYEWTPARGLSNANSASPVASPESTTLYKVRVFNAKGCFYDTALLVTVVPPIKPVFELQISSECGQNATVQFTNRSQDSGEGNYRWLMGNGDILEGKNPKPYSYGQSGEYEIILEVFNGVCKKTSSQKIKAESVKPANVITPNNDGKNDNFVLDFVQSGWKLEVYNRNGSPIFSSDNYQNDWGHHTEAGTYYYLLTSPQGKSCKGWVQVMR